MTDLNSEEEQLFEAVEKQDYDVIVKIIDTGNVRINCLDDSGMTPLDQACHKGNEEVVQYLLDNGANADNRKHNQGYTSLMFAALAGKARICQMLLEAGANPDTTNKIGKTASELAAFVGQHECVSVISSFIDSKAVDKILHPKGPHSETIYSKEFVDFIHGLIKTNDIHPIKIILSIMHNVDALEHRKKLLFVLDSLFEKQLRSKEPNECQSLKLWIILYTLRELLKFVDSKKDQNKSLKEIIELFIKNLLYQEPNDEIKKKVELFLRNAVRSFPYHHSLLFQTLAKSVAKVSYGSTPTCHKLILQSLYGPRFAEVTIFCTSCGCSCAKKNCPQCKSPYCSQECQKLDWLFHKNCCAVIKKRPKPESTFKEYTEEELREILKDTQNK